MKNKKASDGKNFVTKLEHRNEGEVITSPPPYQGGVRGGLAKDMKTDTGNKTGKVWINETQYFDKVPKTAWEFFIGGYQPAQKWLKDRKERTLNFDDIQHYQKIIVALSETDRIMKEIDKLKVE